MTRHGKNSTASMVYSYNERKKDAKSSGYGTLEERLGKDAIKQFDCCSLTLQPCTRPVITPDGILFDKEAILEYILHQKREIARKLKECERQAKKEERELEELAKAEREAKAQRFIRAESTPSRPQPGQTSEEGSSVGVNKSVRNGPSFWVPAVAAVGASTTKETKREKPDERIYCPISGRVLKLKDLIPVHFTPIDEFTDASSSSVAGKKDRYKCAITGDILTNSTKCAVLKTSGSVVTMEAIEQIVRKDYTDPTNGKSLTEADIIPLQRGGTGFASVNEKLAAKTARPVMELQ